MREWKIGDTTECEHCGGVIELRERSEPHACGDPIREWKHRHDTYTKWPTGEVVPRVPVIYLVSCHVFRPPSAIPKEQ